MEKFDVTIIAGNVGTGKTTTGRRLQETLCVTPFDKDALRQELGIRNYDPADTPRIERVVWERMHGLLAAGESTSLSSILHGRQQRASVFNALNGLRQVLAREISVLILTCECSAEIAKARIVSRTGGVDSHFPTNDPTAYDEVAAVLEEVAPEEVDEFASLARFDTERGVVHPVLVRDKHVRCFEKVKAALRAA